MSEVPLLSSSASLGFEPVRQSSEKTFLKLKSLFSSSHAGCAVPRQLWGGRELGLAKLVSPNRLSRGYDYWMPASHSTRMLWMHVTC